MNSKIKSAIDAFVLNKRVKNRLGSFINGGVGSFGHTSRNESRVVDSDYYEAVKEVIIETQINYQIPLSTQEYEEAVKYACKELGY